jgi:hypothetical protein
LDKNEIKKYINRSKKKKCTICPNNSSLSSSVQSTLNTLHSINLKDKTKFNIFFKNLSFNGSSNLTDRVKNNTKLPKPNTDDTKLLYKIFFNHDNETNLGLTQIKEQY